MMNKTKIDWCDFTWNPVTGCKRGCYYCYAKKQARRFCGDVRLNMASPQLTHTGNKTFSLEAPFKSEQGTVILLPAAFAPTFHRYRLPMVAQKKKPGNIFVCSMGDLFSPDIPTRWIMEVFDACAEAPWHNYLFLTKYPERYKALEELALLPHGDNYWFGTTVTRAAELSRVNYIPHTVHCFISIEPIMESINIEEYLAQPWPTIEWVIVGAETGTHHGKHLPCTEWIEALVDAAHTKGVPILLKDSKELRAVWDGNLIQNFPEQLQRQEELPVPRCKECAHATTVQQGKRGISYTCNHGDPKHIQAQHKRTSPPWCPQRKEISK